MMDPDMDPSVLPAEALRLLDFSREIEAELDEHLRGVEEDLTLLRARVDDLEPSSPHRPRSSSPERAAAAGAREDDEEENEREYFEEHRSLGEVTRLCAPSLSALASPSLQDLRRQMPAASILDSLTKSSATNRGKYIADEPAYRDYYGVYEGGEKTDGTSREEEGALSVAAMNASFSRALRMASGSDDKEENGHKSPLRMEAAFPSQTRSGHPGGKGHAEEAGAEAEALSVDAIMAELRALDLDLEAMPPLDTEEGAEDVPEGGTSPLMTADTKKVPVTRSVLVHPLDGKTTHSDIGDGTDAGTGMTSSASSPSSTPGSDGLLSLSTEPSSYLGDYCHWVAGPRLTASGMRDLYSGLRTSRLDSSTPSNSTDSEPAAPSPPIHGSARPVRVLEVVMRPDVPERDILVECFKAARVEGLLCTMRESNHLVLEAVPAIDLLPQQPREEKERERGGRDQGANSNSNSGGSDSSSAQAPGDPSLQNGTTGLAGFRGEGAWDTVDVQVCISRELRQRVVVFQFFLVDGRPGLDDGRPDRRALFPRGPKRYQRLLLILQRLFSAKQLSVSALYRLPRPAAGSPPPYLDAPFVSQLRALCREDMWGVFRSQSADMETHVAEVRGQCAALAECLEPVYKQHGVRMPQRLEEEDTNPSVIASALAASASASVAAAQTQGDAPRQVARTAASTSANDADAGAEEEEDGEGTDSEEQIAADSRAAVASAGGSGRGIESWVFALIDMHKKRFQKRFDKELTRRLKSHLNAAMVATERMGNYRRRLLRILAQSGQAKASALNKSFLSVFEGIELVHEQASIALYQKYCVTASHSDSDLVLHTSDNATVNTTTMTAPANNTIAGGPRRSEPQVQDAAASGSLIGSAMLGSAVAAASSAAAAGLSSWLGWGAPSTASSSATNTTNTAKTSSQAGSDAASPTQPSLPAYLRVTSDHVVLYFCAVIHASMPGYLYITPTAVCVSVRIPGISRLVEAFHLADVHEVVVSRRSGRGMPDSIALRLFLSSHGSSSSRGSQYADVGSSMPHHQSPRELVLTPPVVDCDRLKMIIEETRDLLLHAPLRL